MDQRNSTGPAFAGEGRMRLNTANSGGILAKLIAAAMLFAALGRPSYDYFTLLRWLSCGVCTFTTVQAAEAKRFG